MFQFINSTKVGGHTPFDRGGRIELKTEPQILTFRYSMKVEKEVLDKAIEYLVEMKVIDNHMYQYKAH